MQLREALGGWLLDVRARGRTERTATWYAETVGLFLVWLESRGKADIEGLSALDLRTYISECLGHLAPATRHNRVAAIKAWSKWLEWEDLLPADPFRKVKRPSKTEAERPRALNPAQVRAILSRYDPKDPYEGRDVVMLQLVIDTGLRRAEVCGALLEDLDLDSGSLWVMGKGRRRRRVPLSPEVRSALWKYLKKHRRTPATGGLIFVGRGGGPVNANHLSHTFHCKAGEVGINARFHDLRHTAATLSLKGGMPKERVSRLLGHSNEATTSIYEHLDFEDVQASHSKANPLRLVEGRRYGTG